MSWLAIAFAFWGAFVALGAFIMALARTPPDIAFSNLSLWAKRIGLHNIPAWLQNPSADEIVHRWAKRTIIGLLAIGAIGWAAYFFLSPTSPGVAPPSPPSPSSSINAPDNKGIITQQQSGGTNIINQAPPHRHLTPDQASAIADSIRGSGISVLLTAPADLEVRNYENEIYQALAAGGIAVQFFNMGTMGYRPFGVKVLPNGHDAKALIAALNKGGITPTLEDVPTPVPGSVKQQYSHYISLVVGFRPD